MAHVPRLGASAVSRSSKGGLSPRISHDSSRRGASRSPRPVESARNDGSASARSGGRSEEASGAVGSTSPRATEKGTNSSLDARWRDLQSKERVIAARAAEYERMRSRFDALLRDVSEAKRRARAAEQEAEAYARLSRKLAQSGRERDRRIDELESALTTARRTRDDAERQAEAGRLTGGENVKEATRLREQLREAKDSLTYARKETARALKAGRTAREERDAAREAEEALRAAAEAEAAMAMAREKATNDEKEGMSRDASSSSSSSPSSPTAVREGGEGGGVGVGVEASAVSPGHGLASMREALYRAEAARVEAEAGRHAAEEELEEARQRQAAAQEAQSKAEEERIAVQSQADTIASRLSEAANEVARQTRRADELEGELEAAKMAVDGALRTRRGLESALSDSMGRGSGGLRGDGGDGGDGGVDSVHRSSRQRSESMEMPGTGTGKSRSKSRSRGGSMSSESGSEGEDQAIIAGGRRDANDNEHEGIGGPGNKSARPSSAGVAMGSSRRSDRVSRSGLRAEVMAAQEALVEARRRASAAEEAAEAAISAHARDREMRLLQLQSQEAVANCGWAADELQPSEQLQMANEVDLEVAVHGMKPVHHAPSADHGTDDSPTASDQDGGDAHRTSQGDENASSPSPSPSLAMNEAGSPEKAVQQALRAAADARRSVLGLSLDEGSSAGHRADYDPGSELAYLAGQLEDARAEARRARALAARARKAYDTAVSEARSRLRKAADAVRRAHVERDKAREAEEAAVSAGGSSEDLRLARADAAYFEGEMHRAARDATLWKQRALGARDAARRAEAGRIEADHAASQLERRLKTSHDAQVQLRRQRDEAEGRAEAAETEADGVRKRGAATGRGAARARQEAHAAGEKLKGAQAAVAAARKETSRLRRDLAGSQRRLQSYEEEAEGMLLRATEVSERALLRLREEARVSGLAAGKAQRREGAWRQEVQALRQRLAALGDKAALLVVGSPRVDDGEEAEGMGSGGSVGSPGMVGGSSAALARARARRQMRRYLEESKDVDAGMGMGRGVQRARAWGGGDEERRGRGSPSRLPQLPRAGYPGRDGSGRMSRPSLDDVVGVTSFSDPEQGGVAGGGAAGDDYDDDDVRGGSMGPRAIRGRARVRGRTKARTRTGPVLNLGAGRGSPEPIRSPSLLYSPSIRRRQRDAAASAAASRSPAGSLGSGAKDGTPRTRGLRRNSITSPKLQKFIATPGSGSGGGSAASGSSTRGDLTGFRAGSKEQDYTHDQYPDRSKRSGAGTLPSVGAARQRLRERRERDASAAAAAAARRDAAMGIQPIPAEDGDLYAATGGSLEAGAPWEHRPGDGDGNDNGGNGGRSGLVPVLGLAGLDAAPMGRRIERPGDAFSMHAREGDAEGYGMQRRPSMDEKGGEGGEELDQPTSARSRDGPLAPALLPGLAALAMDAPGDLGMGTGGGQERRRNNRRRSVGGEPPRGGIAVPSGRM